MEKKNWLNTQGYEAQFCYDRSKDPKEEIVLKMSDFCSEDECRNYYGAEPDMAVHTGIANQLKPLITIGCKDSDVEAPKLYFTSEEKAWEYIHKWEEMNPGMCELYPMWADINIVE